ncbi:unnamed protein product [Tilletia controversa]|uniref:Kinesin motor domain-containing protein n=1 Tax=Tilletia controversa TaxID=13291 RepID=A0A8X7MUS1_9BASI|nr:hypothetical protein CF328_g3421 [Tilletia controversa]KAE8248041.1 hypothetical protein A4X06_0g4004 [Tilletia controversa]CAD6904987.1 unnamed protein product [Tilletia controversa]CAD6907902.1 unnamed protein product [Tilletia controversa]
MASRSNNNPPIAGSASRSLLNRTTAARRTTTTSTAGAANTSVSTVGNTSTLGKRSVASSTSSSDSMPPTARRRLGPGGGPSASSSAGPPPSHSSASLALNQTGGGSGATSSGGPSAAQESSNANIQVAVRVRGRSSPSAPRPSDSCVITEGPRSNNIVISADPLSGSTLGGNTASLLPFASPIKKSASAKSKLGGGGVLGTAGAGGRHADPSGAGKGQEGAGDAGSGHSANSNKKTYNFDHVFGPEADQGMVYQDVVAPILKEVLEGYNCTIFAYGQTGTGKTHTMEGDLSPHPSTGTFATDAGIIPRTLFRLFHILETSGSEFSVRASFVELYNEELRDLLAVEDAGSTAGEEAGASSGKGSGGAGKGKDASGAAGFGASGSNGGMRIYDDAKGRGVVIQGLEEVPMTSAEAGLEILRRGSSKRHIAATNCNSQSSRSHSVFTLTIHHTTTSNLSGSQSTPASSGSSAGSRPITLGKDGKPVPAAPGSAQQGEDVMRIGKLNLVDLAGSENIGRSGAADKRAREAGMINQSLLTLGRVINALVEKQSHIPFRESKLTRLLQESLGGRTKTCIIATVSESRSSIDETLSTLEYATRARSIQNRPEMNARTTRTALLSEYIAENLRLRADLKATRSKNGVFLSQETLETMEGNHARAVREAQASKLECDLADSKIQTMKEQLEQNSAVLARKEEEARSARAEWEKARTECARLGVALDTSRKAEKEEVQLREAYMRSESRVNGVAEGLRGVVEQSTGEVGLLLDKLARKTDVEKKNQTLMNDCYTTVRELVSKLEAQVADFKTNHERFSTGLADSLHAFSSAQENTKDERLENIGDAFKSVQEALADVREGHTVTYERAQDLASQVGRVRETIMTLSQGRTKQFEGFLQAFFQDVRTRQGNFEHAVASSLQALSSQTEELHTGLDRFVEVNEAHVDEVRRVASETVEEHRRMLKADRARLEESVRSERVRAQAAKTVFLQAVQGAADELVGGGLHEYERFAKELDAPIKKRAELVDSFERGHQDALAPVDEQRQLLAQLGKEKEEAQAEEMKTLGAEVDSWNDDLEKRLKTLEKKELVTYQRRCEADVEHEDRQLEEILKSVTEDAEVNKEVLDRAADTMQSGAEGLSDTAKAGLASISLALQQMTNSTASQILSQRKIGVAFLESNAKNLGKVRYQAKDHLQKRALHDVATGSTPRKHGWNYPTEWSTMPSSRTAAMAHVEEHGPGEDTFGFDYSAAPPSQEVEDEAQMKDDIVRETARRAGMTPRFEPEIVDREQNEGTSSTPLRPLSGPAEEMLLRSSSSMMLLTPGRSRRAGRKTSVLAEYEDLGGESPLLGASGGTANKENAMMGGGGMVLSPFPSISDGLFAKGSPIRSSAAGATKKTKSTLSKIASSSSGPGSAAVLPSSPSGSRLLMNNAKGRTSSRRGAGVLGEAGVLRTPPRSGR